MLPFRTLYLDMNSFFASVEQQLDPALRGKPLGITAMEEEVGICVAASYEAKAYGVGTGTPVVEPPRLARSCLPIGTTFATGAGSLSPGYKPVTKITSRLSL